MTFSEPEWLRRALSREADLAFRRRVRSVLEYIAPQPGDCILDCGCGRGFYLLFIGRIEPACTLYGADMDPAVLAQARQHLPDTVHLFRSDALHLPFPDAFFDKVICSEVLEHLPDDRAGLRELRRVLKPAGVLAITVPNHDYPFWWDPVNKTREMLGLSPVREGFWGGIWANHERLYHEEALVARVREMGFLIEDVRRFTHYCLPFTHNIVYGFGKEALEHGWLPQSLTKQANRFAYADAPPSPWNPINWGLALFDLVDRLNDRAEGKRTYVNLALKARRGERVTSG